MMNDAETWAISKDTQENGEESAEMDSVNIFDGEKT